MIFSKGWDISMGRWKKIFIKEIATINMGQSPDNNFVNQDQMGIPFLQGNADFGQKYPVEQYWCTSPKKIANKGDTLISVRAPVGEINNANQKYCIGRGLASINFNVDKDFGQFSLFNEIRQLYLKSQGSTFLAISKKDVENAQLFIPENLAEQEKIAEILSTIDTAIEKTKAIVKKYKNIKEGLLQDLLTNGIDGNGNIRSPETHKYKDSPLGKIPVEWECKELDKICKLISSGGTPSRKNDLFWEADVPWITTGEINFNKINMSQQSISIAGLKNSSAKLYPQGTILIAMYGEGQTRGKVSLLNFVASTNQACAGLIVQEIYNNIYLYYYLLKQYKRLRDLSNDGSQKNLSLKILKSLFVLIPIRKAEQQEIAKRLDAIDAKIQTEQAFIAKIEAIKKGLMQDLLTNTVSVDCLL